MPTIPGPNSPAAYTCPSQEFVARALYELTQQHESRFLFRWLLDVARTSFPGSDCRYYLVHNANVLREEGGAHQGVPAISDAETNSAPVAVASHSALLKAASEAGPIIAPTEGGEWQFIWPVLAAGEIHAMLVVTNARREPLEESRNVLECFMGIYCNYYSLIFEMEIDPLTRLLNRRTFDSQISSLVSDGQALGSCYCLAMADIDHFKKINDTYGHLFGDEVLIHFANILRSTFRYYDLLFRYGGEEFIIVAQVRSPDSCHTIMERVRLAVAAYEFPQVGHITTSVGFTRFNPDLPISTLIDAADQALYYAKEHGRNQVQCYEDLEKDGKVKSVQLPADMELWLA